MATCFKCNGTGKFFATYGKRAGEAIGECFKCKGTGSFPPSSSERSDQDSSSSSYHSRSGFDRYESEDEDPDSWRNEMLPQVEEEENRTAVGKVVQVLPDAPPGHQQRNYHFPRILDLTVNKKMKLHLQDAKVVMFLNGKLALVAPQFGAGIYGYFDRRSNVLTLNKGFFKLEKEKQERILAQLVDVEARGLEACKEISSLLGHCCMCGRTLVAEDSINAGIGPICAGKW